MNENKNDDDNNTYDISFSWTTSTACLLVYIKERKKMCMRELRVGKNMYEWNMMIFMW